MVEEEKNLRNRLQGEVQQFKSEVAELCDELQQPQFVLPSGLDSIRLRRNAYKLVVLLVNLARLYTSLFCVCRLFVSSCVHKFN